MRKRVVLSIVFVLFIGLIVMSLYNKFHKENREHYSFQLPKVIEDKILSSREKKPQENKSFLLDGLINSGKWVEIPIPKRYDQWKKLEERFDEWEVNKAGGINVNEPVYQSISGYNFQMIDASEGFLLRVAKREWGGALYFYPNGDRNKKYKILDGDIWPLYKEDNKIFAFQAFPIEKKPYGKMLSIKKSFFKWRAKELTVINDLPYSQAYAEKNIMYLVTYNKLIKMNNYKINEVILDNTFWGGLYPTTAVYDKGYLYIGMRAGVAKVNIKSKQMQFFTPKELINTSVDPMSENYIGNK